MQISLCSVAYSAAMNIKYMCLNSTSLLVIGMSGTFILIFKVFINHKILSLETFKRIHARARAHTHTHTHTHTHIYIYIHSKLITRAAYYRAQLSSYFTAVITLTVYSNGRTNIDFCMIDYRPTSGVGAKKGESA